MRQVAVPFRGFFAVVPLAVALLAGALSLAIGDSPADCIHPQATGTVGFPCLLGVETAAVAATAFPAWNPAWIPSQWSTQGVEARQPEVLFVLPTGAPVSRPSGDNDAMADAILGVCASRGSARCIDSRQILDLAVHMEADGVHWNAVATRPSRRRFAPSPSRGAGCSWV